VSRVDTLFDELAALQVQRRLPPVQHWHPEREGRIDIRIDRDGTWYHEGDPIRRKPLVRLFSTILRKDPDGYCLVTPAERLLIEVADAPFVATDLEIKGRDRSQQLLFVTNVDDYVIADEHHRIRIDGTADLPRPYVRVRDDLDALIGRSVYYRLAELCESDADGYWLWSSGIRFRVG